MATNFKHYNSGDVYGLMYVFDKAGEGIPMHSHDYEMLHNVVVLRGKIAVYSPNGDNLKVLVHGQIYDFDSTKPHEIAALTDGATILNLYLSGMPAEYINRPLNELEGKQHLTLTHIIPDFQNPQPHLVH